MTGRTTGPKVKTAKAPITVNGTVAKTTTADGDTTYTLTAGGKTYIPSTNPGAG